MSRETEKINFLAGVQVGNVIYFSAWNVNGLFIYNPHTEECSFLKSFPGEENWGLHSEAVLYGNTIWFIPRASERIAIVNLDNLDISYLELPEQGHRPKDRNIPPRRIVACHEVGEKYLWLIPYAYKLFIKIDMERQRIISVQKWGNDEYAYAVGMREQNKLWVSIYSSREIRVIDLQTDEQIVKKNKKGDIYYSGIQNINEQIYLFPHFMKDGILLLDDDMGEKVKVYCDDNEQWYYEYGAFTEDGDILLVPYWGNRCVRVHAENDQCFIKEMIDLQVEENAYCSAKMVYNDQIWFLSHVSDRPIYSYEKKKNIFCHRYIKKSRKKYEEEVVAAARKYGMKCTPFSSDKVINETSLSLEQFVRLIKYENEEIGMEKKSEVGRSIYNAIQ